MPIRPFASYSPAELEAAIRALEDGLLSGVASVSHNGETVTYRGIDTIERILTQARESLALKTEPEKARPQAALRVVYPRYSRGLI